MKINSVMPLVLIFKFHASVRLWKQGKYAPTITYSNSLYSRNSCFPLLCSFPLLKGDDLGEKKINQISFAVYLTSPCSLPGAPKLLQIPRGKSESFQTPKANYLFILTKFQWYVCSEEIFLSENLLQKYVRDMHVPLSY